MLVIAIDVGIKNLAYCAVQSCEGCPVQIVAWQNVPLTTGTYQPCENVAYVRAFAEKHSVLFALADRVVIERQMRVNMRIIEALLQHTYFDKCTVVNARTVKGAFGLCKRNYRLNKQAAVEMVEGLMRDGDPWQRFYALARKKDDLADAYLMALFFSAPQQAQACPPSPSPTGEQPSSSPPTPAAATTTPTLPGARTTPVPPGASP